MCGISYLLQLAMKFKAVRTFDYAYWPKGDTDDVKNADTCDGKVILA
jgi:hypothetical protein